MPTFIRSFWPSTFLAAAVCSLLLHFWWAPLARNLAPRPNFAGLGSTYVADYGDSGSIAHYLYQYGIFGLRDRLQKSDVLLLGSSHVMMGFSAATLTNELSAQENRPVHVYNMAVGFGDAFGFDQAVWTRNQLGHKPVVVDLFMQYGDDLSPYAQKVGRGNLVSAYYTVGDLWLRYAQDWALDPLLPHFRFTSQGSAPSHRTLPAFTERFLQGMNLRRWDDGDVVELWSPIQGPIYREALGGPASETRSTQSSYDLRPNASVSLSSHAQELLQKQDFNIVYTLIPFDAYQSATMPPNAQPFIPIPSEGLTLFDEGHLTADGRDLATQRLFEGMKARGLIDSWLDPRHSPEGAK